MSMFSSLAKLGNSTVAKIAEKAADAPFAKLKALQSRALSAADSQAVAKLSTQLDDATYSFGKEVLAIHKSKGAGNAGGAMRAEQKIKDLDVEIGKLKARIEAPLAAPAAAAAAAPSVAPMKTTASKVVSALADKEAAFESQMRAFAANAPDGIAGIRQVTAHAAKLRAEMGLPPK